MAASTRKRCAPAALALGTALALTRAHGAIVLTPQQAITLDAQSSELDYRNNTLEFHKVKISQGALSVSADSAEASGLDFENSHWVFRGNVKIVMTQGQLTSDQADITFAKKVLAQAVATGNPAAFEQLIVKTGRVARGRADSIVYDVAKGTVRLAKNAWLSDGQREISGESLTYSVADQRVVAAAAEQGAQRVHITITPPPTPTPKP
jgi:lipopolysaccharide transport protein LptA